MGVKMGIFVDETLPAPDMVVKNYNSMIGEADSFLDLENIFDKSDKLENVESRDSLRVFKSKLKGDNGTPLYPVPNWNDPMTDAEKEWDLYYAASDKWSVMWDIVGNKANTTEEIAAQALNVYEQSDQYVIDNFDFLVKNSTERWDMNDIYNAAVNATGNNTVCATSKCDMVAWNLKLDELAPVITDYPDWNKPI